MMELSESSGYDIAMTVVNSMSKHAHFIPIYTTITVKGMVQLFLYNIWKLHGLPQCVVLNRSLHFVALST